MTCRRKDTHLRVVVRQLLIATIIFWSSVVAFIGIYQVYDALPQTHKMILNDVKLSDQVDKLIHTLKDAGPEDTVIINVASHGGSVTVMNQILNSIRMSEAKVITVNDGAGYSAGAILSLAGDEIIVREYASFMFHLARYMTWTGVEILDLDHPIQKMVINQLDDIAGKYLTDDEVYSILIGNDVFIDGAIMKARIALFKDEPNDGKVLRILDIVQKQKQAKDYTVIPSGDADRRGVWYGYEHKPEIYKRALR